MRSRDLSPGGCDEQILAPQVTIFDNFGERIVRSIVFNIADWLDGNISYGQGLINVGVDTFNSFVQLGIDELNFFLPPLPPLPPFPFAVTRTPLTAVQAQTPASPATKQSLLGAERVGNRALKRKRALKR
jgi:hypothetical protein